MNAAEAGHVVRDAGEPPRQLMAAREIVRCALLLPSEVHADEQHKHEVTKDDDIIRAREVDGSHELLFVLRCLFQHTVHAPHMFAIALLQSLCCSWLP